MVKTMGFRSLDFRLNQSIESGGKSSEAVAQAPPVISGSWALGGTNIDIPTVFTEFVGKGKPPVFWMF